MPAAEHKSHAPRSIRCAILTVSDTRTPDTDEGGNLLKEMLENAGHEVVSKDIVPDDGERITERLQQYLGDVQAVITTGGTGLSYRDVTVETVEPLLDKRLNGFGEYLRMLSYNEIGSAGMMSRTTAGVARNTVVICLPGSRNAVELAVRELVLPELGHMVYEVTK